MGDRANVAIVQWDNKGFVYLYTHWNGSNLPHVVKNALKKKLRWSDPSYLARIIFDEMVSDADSPETGYGIATFPPDNEHSIIVVDSENGVIGFANENCEPICYIGWTFANYIKLSTKAIDAAYNKE